MTQSSSTLPSDESTSTKDTTKDTTSEQRRRELADFLRTRREKLKPEQVGLPSGARRRTPGLRREEVAELAGVGTTWYTWLEQARDIQPSGEVLRRLGEALKLNAAEMRHVFALAGKAAPVDLGQMQETVSESLNRVLEHSLQVPAVLLGARWDVLDMNQKARDILPALIALPKEKQNWMYYVLCLEATRSRLQDWAHNCQLLVGEFRASVTDFIDSPWVQELVELLRKDCPEFEGWWREHNVRDSQAKLIELHDKNLGRFLLENTVLRPWENSRYRILLWTPVTK